MNKITPADMKRLSELLGSELKFFKQIRELMEKQTKLLSKDDIEAFDTLLEQKTEIIEKINGLHQDISPLMQSYTSSKIADNAIDGLWAQIKEELRFCAKLNTGHIEQMSEMSQELSNEIDEKRSKREGIGGYAQASTVTSEMFDKEI